MTTSPPGPAPALALGPGPGPDDADPGLARIRTSLAWTRTALSYAAVGAVTLKKDVIAGLLIIAVAPVIWRLGRLAHHRPGRSGWSPRRSWRSPWSP